MTEKGLNRGAGYGLEVLVTYTNTGLEETVARYKEIQEKKWKTSEKIKINA